VSGGGTLGGDVNGEARRKGSVSSVNTNDADTKASSS
jgi:hypothetical protein